MKHARQSRYGLYLAAVLWLSMFIAAFPTGAAPMDSVPSMDVVRSKLELTPEQETQLRPIFENRLAELQQVRTRLEQATSKSDKRAVLRDSKQQAQAFNTQVESLLSPSQKTQWRELRAETRDKIKQRYEEKRGSGN
jgi:hypothetical protein